MIELQSTLLFIGGVLLLLVGMVVIGLGAWAWANAIAATHRARAHGFAADENERIAEEAHEAFNETIERKPRGDYQPPSEEDLVEGIRAGRDEKEYTTLGNEGIEEAAPIGGGGMYRTADTLDQ